MIKKIYFDESGFTGYNHLDPLQPIFALGSHDLEPKMAEDILFESFPRYRGEEFKFSTLWKSNRKQFVNLAMRLAYFGQGIRFWVIDKKFAVIVKMVDFLIEPAVTSAGYNFLADGFGRKYANYIYFGLNTLGTPGSVDMLISAYQSFSRNPKKETLKELSYIVRTVYQNQSLELKPFLGQMLDGVVNFEIYNDLETFKSTNDLQFTAMLAAIIDWRKSFKEDFEVIHDSSSNFLRQRETWEQITSGDAFKHSHPLGDGSFVEFPLRVRNTSSADSKNNYSIQLSDLLAGYASRHFDLSRPQAERLILDEIVDAGLSKSYFNGIRPSYDFPSLPPKKLNGPDAVDLMMKMMNKI